MIKPADDPDVQVLRLRVRLMESEPEIWRRFLVPGDMPLDELHDVLQVVMGWENLHLHCFRKDDRTWVDPESEPGPDDLSEWEYSVGNLVAEPGDRFEYEYDFGDGWLHEVELEAVEAHEPGTPYPACLDGANACPPEDCGGVFGYADLLEALADPDHENHAEAREWAGDSLDPGAFDVEAVNRGLQGG